MATSASGVSIEAFFTEADAISPGGAAAIGIRVNGVVATYCIGSGADFRAAKACALLHLRTVLEQVRALQNPNDGRPPA